MCDETSCIDGRVANLPIFQELTDLWRDSVPDSVERRVKDSNRQSWQEDEGVPSLPLGDGEGMFEEIRVVEEVTMVGRDTVVVRGPLPVRD